MSEKTWKVAHESALKQVAYEVIQLLKSPRGVAFYGEMGSGKTTFIKFLCMALGVDSAEISSPTFSIVNEYQGKGRIYHFDVYRIKSEEEMYDIGYEEYFFSNAWVFVEWAEKIEALIPDDFAAISIQVPEEGQRQIRMEF